MKSILILFIGLAVCFWGFSVTWGYSVTASGFSAAKYHYLAGGVILFGGLLLNQWEHTRRR